MKIWENLEIVIENLGKFGNCQNEKVAENLENLENLGKFAGNLSHEDLGNSTEICVFGTPELLMKKCRTEEAR